MKFNAIEIVNVLIVIFLLNIIVCRRDVTTLLLVLFVYGTLHFGFATPALATSESASLLVELHTEGGGILAKLSAFVLLGVVFTRLSVLAYDTWLCNQLGEREVVSPVLMAMGILFCGYLLNIRPDDWLQLQNVVSMEAFLVLLLLGYLGIKGRARDVANLHSWAFGGLLLLLITDCIAIYEVVTQSSWAGTLESSGAKVYRASSLLFNPNLLGFWASLIYLGCAYGMHECKEKGYRGWLFWGMILAAIAIYFSGSRSAGYLLLGALFVSSMLTKGRSRWLPLTILPMTMLVIYVGAAWVMPTVLPGKEGWHEIALLGNRFAQAPLYLVKYSLQLFGAADIISRIDILSEVISNISVPPEVTASIEGRFEGSGRDAGWLVLYQDVGWLGVGTILWSSFKSLQWALRAYFVQHSVASVYALTAVCYCLMTGLVMRFQIFPVWVFMGVILIPCLVFWTQAVNSKSGNDRQ